MSNHTRTEFDRGYEDAANTRPMNPTSLEYLRGYARGEVARDIIEAEAARAARRVVLVGDGKPDAPVPNANQSAFTVTISLDAATRILDYLHRNLLGVEEYNHEMREEVWRCYACNVQHTGDQIDLEHDSNCVGAAMEELRRAIP